MRCNILLFFFQQKTHSKLIISGVMQPHSFRGAAGRHRLVICIVGRTCSLDCTVLLFVHERITQWKWHFLSELNQMRCKNANIIIKQSSRGAALNYLCICVIILTSRRATINIESVSNKILASRHSNCTVSFYTAAANQSIKKGKKHIFYTRNVPFILFINLLFSHYK